MVQQRERQQPQQRQMQSQDQKEAARRAREAALDASWKPLPEEKLLEVTLDQQY